MITTPKGTEVTVTDPDSPLFGRRGIISSEVDQVVYQVEFTNNEGATLTTPVGLQAWQITNE